MLWKILKPLIYPFEFSFFVEGPAERNFIILQELIKSHSLKIYSEKDGEVIFSLPVYKVISGWGFGFGYTLNPWLSPAVCTFTRYSEKLSKMTFFLKENGSLFGLFLD